MHAWNRHTRGSSNQHNFVQRLVDRLRRRGFLIDDIVSGETKCDVLLHTILLSRPLTLWDHSYLCGCCCRIFRYMGVCRLNDAGYGIARRIDIMGIVQEEWVRSDGQPRMEYRGRSMLLQSVYGVAGVCCDLLYGFWCIQSKDAAACCRGWLYAERTCTGARLPRVLLAFFQQCNVAHNHCDIMMTDCAGSWQCPVDPQTKAKGAPLPIPDERCACLRVTLAPVASGLSTCDVNAGRCSRGLGWRGLHRQIGSSASDQYG